MFKFFKLLEEVPGQFRDLPVPDALQTGRTVIITGANVGLGLEAARHFTRLQADRVIVACRDKSKGDAAVSSIRASHPDSPTKLDVWLVDLGDFASVKALAEKAEKLDRVDVLVSNAGLATAAYVERSDGWESTLAVNIIGTFLLIFLMMPKMRETAKKYKTTPHTTVVASGAGHLASFPERKEENIFQALKANRNLFDRYNVSKLLQVIITKQLAAATRRSNHPADENIIFNTVHPGLCQTEIFRSMPFPLNYPMNFVNRVFGRTSEMGSRCLLAGALAGDEANGRYMESCVVADYAPILNGEEGEAMQIRVWEELVAILEETRPGITSLI